MYPQPTNYSVEIPNTPQGNSGRGLAIGALICGIVSVTIFCCYGSGLVPAIIALVLSSKYYQQSTVPNGMAKAGRILGIIGLILNILFIILWVIFYAVYIIYGVAFMSLGPALNSSSSYSYY